MIRQRHHDDRSDISEIHQVPVKLPPPSLPLIPTIAPHICFTEHTTLITKGRNSDRRTVGLEPEAGRCLRGQGLTGKRRQLPLPLRPVPKPAGPRAPIVLLFMSLSLPTTPEMCSPKDVPRDRTQRHCFSAYQCSDPRAIHPPFNGRRQLQ